MVWKWRRRFLCFLGPLTHLTFRTSWKHQPFMYMYRQIYREPSHGSIMVTMNFGRWWTTCWTRPRIVLRSMPLMTLTRQPCIMQPGGDQIWEKSMKWKGWRAEFLSFFWLAVLGTRKLESYKSNICMYINMMAIAGDFKPFCFLSIFHFHLLFRNTTWNDRIWTTYFSTGLKSPPSVISRISRLMSRAKLFLCWVAPTHLQEEHFAYIEGHPIIQLWDQLMLVVQFIQGWWKPPRWR